MRFQSLNTNYEYKFKSTIHSYMAELCSLYAEVIEHEGVLTLNFARIHSAQELYDCHNQSYTVIINNSR